jgi:hypothetical protein
MTWRRILIKNARVFGEWLEATGKRIEAFDRLATALEVFLMDYVLGDGPGTSASASCAAFANALPLVLEQCDESIYDEPLVAEAYAFVHLLERYRRFTQVLDELLETGILPMRDHGIRVLDVGSGPGPALYATADFYQQLREFAEAHGIPELNTPPPTLHAVEFSPRMSHVMHLLSELSQRDGPFGATLHDFEGVNFDELRLRSRNRIAAQLEQDLEWEVTQWDWQDEWRYNLGIFSYYLTRDGMVEALSEELGGLFRSMRAGGVVVTIGAVAGRYRKVYKGVEKIAKRELMRRNKRAPTRVFCSYTDPYAARIKFMYDKVWKHLETRLLDTTALKKRLPADLWNPAAPLHGPNAFGLRVLRRVDIKPVGHSWYKAYKRLRKRRSVRT